MDLLFKHKRTSRSRNRKFVYKQCRLTFGGKKWIYWLQQRENMEQNKINRFLENDLNKRLPFAWYLLGSMIVIIFSFVGQFPMLFFTSEESTATMDPKNPMSMFAHLDANLLLFLILFSFFISFLGFLIVLKKIHRQSFTSVTTARTSIDIKRFFFGFILWGGVVILTVLVDYFIFPQDYEITFQFN